MKSRHEGIGLPLHGLKEELLTLSVLGSGTCSYYVRYKMMVNERKTNTDSCVLYLSVHYSAWSMEQHEVKPSGHSIGLCTGIRERGSVLYLGISTEILNLP